MKEATPEANQKYSGQLERSEEKRAREALRDFVAKEKNREISSGHFLAGRGIEEGFDDTQVPDDEVIIFWKANKKEITDEEFQSYRKKLLDERGVLKPDINPSRHAVLQYVNNMMMVIQGGRYLEAEKKRSQNEKNQN